MKLITPALVDIKLVYYPREERLVSLDVLKLYRGEDDQWLDEGEFTELPKVYRREAEERLGNKA